MAGGSGTRLWPLSRRDRPKQLLRFLGGKSLLRIAFERLACSLDPCRIHVITNAKHLSQVAKELPELPTENLFGEPEGRDTANAVALAAAILHERDPHGVMGVFTADHVMMPVERFTEAITAAFKYANANPTTLMTLGIPVRSPETAFGYIERGQPVADGLYEVAKFVEKPDADRARQYADSGNHYWNSGMFAWRTSAILDELRINLPDSHEGVMEIAKVWDTPQRDAKLSAIYPTLRKISIDYAVMERARRVMVVEMNCQWADVGSWSQLGAVLQPDPDGNVIATGESLHPGTKGTIVVSESGDHLIATVGVSDLIVIHSPDATLVCRKDDAQSLKKLLAEIEAKYGDKYL